MRKLALRLVLAIGLISFFPGCGGGGDGGVGGVSGGAGGTSSSTPPSNGTLSVTVTDPAGVPVRQVLVNLSGTSISSALTNSNGAYSFSSLAPGNYTATPTLLLGVNFSPASTSVAVSASSNATTAFVATYSTTAQIANYAAALHLEMLRQFASDDQAIANQFAATVGALSGARFQASMNDFTGLVQSFVNSSLADVQTQSQTMPVDYPAVAALLSAYATQDLAFVSAYFGGNATFNSLVSSTQSTISSAYAVAKSSLP